MMKRHLAVVLAVAAIACFQALGQEFPLDRWGRHPVKVNIERHSDVYEFQKLGVSIEELRDGYIEAAVTPDKLKELLDKGWRVEPRIEEPLSPDIPAAYHNYNWLTAKLDSVHAQYPGITRKVSMGTSVQGRQLWAFLVTSHPDSAMNKAEVRFAATIHGDEPVGTEMCLGMIDSLTQCYGTVPAITELVNGREIWFAPMLNPDGNSGNSRYNANGEDLNRDFPVPDGGSNQGYVSGTEIEVLSFMNFWNNKRVVLSLNFHGGALVANYPWDYTYDLCPDNDLAREVSLGYARLNPPMYNSAAFDSGVTNGAAWYIVRGGLQDWSYHWTSGLDVTMEISNTKWPSAGTLPTFWSDNRASMLYFIRQAGWGVQGAVTDSLTGAPLNRVQVDVGGIDKPVYTDSIAGDYHRMLMTGYYDLTFSKSGYRSKTFSNVRVRLDSVTTLDAALAPLLPGNLSGVVRDSADGTPIAGAAVSLSGGGSDTTDALGQYSISTYQDHHTVTASAAGYRTKFLDGVPVGAASVLDIDMAPVYSYTYFSNNTISIPDAGAWIEDSIYVDRTLTLADYLFYVNITHPYIGDLAVRVFSPGGDSLRLHLRTGGSADDIVGWYDSGLAPADLARWEALVGENAHGYWRLRAKDFASTDVGQLNGWGLQIFSSDTGVEGGPQRPGAAPAPYLSSRPNPFRTGTVITYTQPGPGSLQVELAVYNVAGQRVATLANGLHSPAKYLQEWDGRDQEGRSLAAGVYLARLSVGGRSVTRKLVAVR